MRHIAVLKNTIQNYSWGSETAIAELLGVAPQPETPQAELWMGAHPKAPSQAQVDGRWVSLEVLIEENPEEILGAPAVEKFGSRLPFLFKVLAAARPLSLQAHPSRQQARRGYERENRLGIPLDAANRNYKDDNHKPECICALTPFWAMSGFRGIEQTLQLLDTLDLRGLRDLVKQLRAQPEAAGLKAFFQSLMTLPDDAKRKICAEAVAKALPIGEIEPVFSWMTALAAEYPGDIGILSPVFLNLVELQPGEAVALPAGQLHAYLQGVGIELMANSDNVLRGGLTGKHVDVAELLEVLRFEPRPVRRLLPEPAAGAERTYASVFEEFVLSVISVTADTGFTSAAERSAEILLCTAGGATIIETGTGQTLPFSRGTSVLVPAAVADYEIAGDATVYKASVPL
jgi:mannose-6-phosphate isomerase